MSEMTTKTYDKDNEKGKGADYSNQTSMANSDGLRLLHR